MVATIDPSTITETHVKDVRVGMVRQYNQGQSTIISITRESPRSQTYVIRYRSNTPRADGHHNTGSHRTTGYLPIVTNGVPVMDCPAKDCAACAQQVALFGRK